MNAMKCQRWKRDIAYAMTPFKLITWPIGVWPLQVYDINSLIRCAFGTCCAASLLILPSIEIYMGCTDTERNMDCLILMFCGIIGMMKTILFRIYGNNLTENYGSALKDYLTIENEKERTIMRRHALMGRILCCCMISFSYSSGISQAVSILRGENNKINLTYENPIREYLLPSRCAMEYMFSPSRRLYKIIFFIQSIMLFAAASTYVGNDVMFLNILLHMCGQMQILRKNFMDVDVTNPKIYDYVNILIKRHVYLISIIRRLTKTINFILLLQVVLSIILICIMGFQFILSLKFKNISVMVKSFCMLNTFLIQLLLYSFVGDYLKSQMEEIGPSIYQSLWYGYPTKLMKNVIFILMRAQSPVILQAGNFIVVNLPTYMSILKTSLSYLSVFRVMLEI